jgi:hypothetical protein
MKLPDRGSAISLGMKRMGARNAGNPHVACDAEGAWKRGLAGMPRPGPAPVLDPTCERLGVKFPGPTLRAQ